MVNNIYATSLIYYHIYFFNASNMKKRTFSFR